MTNLKDERVLLDWKAIGRRIRGLRGFDATQAEFARSVGLSQSQLSRIERGASEAGAETLLRISKVYKRSINWILTGEDQ